MFAPCSWLVLSLVLQVLHGHGGSAADYITASTPLLPNQTLVSSPGQTFELGFFTPNGSQNLYVGIWYKQPRPSRVAWVANRENPISTSDRLSVSLSIGADGNLNLVDGRGNTVWHTNVSTANNSLASISDGGNFALQDGSSNELWGSFEDPCDTFLPGMKLGIISRTGLKHYLTLWKTENDPSRGAFVAGMTPETLTQLVTWDGSKLYWRSGQWDKATFIGMPGTDQNYLNGITITQDIKQGTVYLTFQPYDSSFYPFLYISPTESLDVVEDNIT